MILPIKINVIKNIFTLSICAFITFACTEKECIVCNSLKKEVVFLKAEVSRCKSINNELAKELKLLNENNKKLKIENEELKVTEQVRFEKAVDCYILARSLNDFKKTSEALNSFILKFPNSENAKSANVYIKKCKEKILELKKLDDFEKTYRSFILNNDYDKALELLGNAKDILNRNEINDREKYINSKINQPIKISINRLVNGFADSKDKNYTKFHSEKCRVELIGIFYPWRIDRERQTLYAMQSGSDGSGIEISYAKAKNNQSKNKIIDGGFDAEWYEIRIIGIIKNHKFYDKTPVIEAEYVEINDNLTF